MRDLFLTGTFGGFVMLRGSAVHPGLTQVQIIRSSCPSGRSVENSNNPGTQIQNPGLT